MAIPKPTSLKAGIHPLGNSQAKNSCMLNAPAVGAYLQHIFNVANAVTVNDDNKKEIQAIIDACDTKNNALIETPKKIIDFKSRSNKDWLASTKVSDYDFVFEEDETKDIHLTLMERVKELKKNTLLQLTTSESIPPNSPIISEHSVVVGCSGGKYWIFDAKHKKGENDFESVLHVFDQIGYIVKFISELGNVELNKVTINQKQAPTPAPLKTSNRRLHHEIDELLTQYLTNKTPNLKNTIIIKINDYKANKQGKDSDKVKVYDTIIKTIEAAGEPTKLPAYNWLHSIAEAKKPLVEAAMRLENLPAAPAKAPVKKIISMNLIPDHKNTPDAPHTMELIKVFQNEIIFKDNDELAQALNAANIVLTFDGVDYPITGKHENGIVVFYHGKNEVISHDFVKDYKTATGKCLSEEVMEQLAFKLAERKDVEVTCSVRAPKPHFKV